MNLLIYLFEANLSLLLLWGLYRVGLERLTFFEWNRFYLLGSLLFGVCLPFFALPSFAWLTPATSAVSHSHDYHIIPQPVYIYPYAHPFISTSVIRLTNLLMVGYWLVVGGYAIKLLTDIYAVIRLARISPRDQYGSIPIIRVAGPMPTSSFFHYIFVNQNQLQDEALFIAIAHEQVHSQQWHSLDWLVIRLISTLFWFNPTMAFWKRAIALNHEYIADSHVVKTCHTTYYAHLLVSLAAHSRSFSTLHFFSYGQLKSRIFMLHQLRSKAIQRMRFLGVTPLLLLILTLVSCEQSLTTEWVAPAVLPKGDFLLNNLIGTWTTFNRMTINDNDGKIPRDFPDRSGTVRACTSRLVLAADGSFKMLEEQTGQRLSGTWQSDKTGKFVQLHYVEAGGTLSAEPVVKTIALKVTYLQQDLMEAWQPYASEGRLSGGTIYYEYRKQ